MTQKRTVYSKDIECEDIAYPFADVSLRLRCSPSRLENTEDAIAVIPVGDEGVVIAVADGVGGSPGGRDAANIVLETLATAIGPAADEELPLIIIGAIESANNRLVEIGRGWATTIAVAEVVNGKMRSYHVGDSEIAVVGQRGKLKHRVVPHSPTGFAVESGMLTEKAAMHHEYRHVLLNVIGATAMRVEVASPVDLALRDTVIVASDGLTDNLYPEEIFELIRRGPLPAAADQLLELAAKRMMSNNAKLPSKPDDMSLILYRSRAAKKS